jgi:hypothetical protein
MSDERFAGACFAARFACLGAKRFLAGFRGFDLGFDLLITQHSALITSLA